MRRCYWCDLPEAQYVGKKTFFFLLGICISAIKIGSCFSFRFRMPIQVTGTSIKSGPFFPRDHLSLFSKAIVIGMLKHIPKAFSSLGKPKW